MDESRNTHEASEEKASTPAEGKVSRRGLIAKGAAVAAGGVGLAAVVATPAEAAAGTMLYGALNDAGSDQTGLASTNGGETFFVINNGSGNGIRAFGGIDGIVTDAYRYGLYASGDRAQLFLEPANDEGPPSGTHLMGEVFVDSLGRHFHRVGDPATWVRPGLNPLDPFRVCDTRSGTGTPYSNGVKLGAGANLLIHIAGVTGVPVPLDAAAIVGNLTVTGGTATSYLTAYPANIAAPTASNINFVAGQTIANQITVALNTNGDIRIRNNAGSVHVILDLAGFFF